MLHQLYMGLFLLLVYKKFSSYIFDSEFDEFISNLRSTVRTKLKELKKLILLVYVTSILCNKNDYKTQSF